jgi:hypothetical protein
LSLAQQVNDIDFEKINGLGRGKRRPLSHFRREKAIGWVLGAVLPHKLGIETRIPKGELKPNCK